MGTTVTLTATPGVFTPSVIGRRRQPITRAPSHRSGNVFTAIFTNFIPLETRLLRQWDQSYAGPGFNHLTSLAPSGDGAYLLGGYANGGVGQTKTSTNYGDFDYWSSRSIVEAISNGTRISAGAGRTAQRNASPCWLLLRCAEDELPPRR